MDLKDKIEDLIASEDLQTSKEIKEPHELPSIQLEPQTKRGLGQTNSPKVGGIEKRQFHRADVSGRRIGVKFSSSAQFARQYIENISMGGMFVKTDEKHSMGTLLPIEFSIPSSNAQMVTFTLSARVCRVTQDGIGLEFTNLSQEYRTHLETFVRDALPKGINPVAKPKEEFINRLESLRLKRKESSEKVKDSATKIVLILLLLILNGLLIREEVQDQMNEVQRHSERIHIQNKEIAVESIRSIEKLQDNQWLIRTSNGQSLTVKASEINESALPSHLQHTIYLLKSLQPRKEIRRSKNTRGLSSAR